MVWPELNVDGITLGLVVIAVLPWFAAILKSVELPGGFKLEFQDLQEAVAQITDGTAGKVRPAEAIRAPSAEAPLLVRADDPNLALVRIRIEIEKGLRRLSERHNIPSNQTLGRIIHDLRRAGILTAAGAGGLERVITAGNKAAHGAKVDPEVADYAQRWAEDIIEFLEHKLGV